MIVDASEVLSRPLRNGVCVMRQGVKTWSICFSFSNKAGFREPPYRTGGKNYDVNRIKYGTRGI